MFKDLKGIVDLIRSGATDLRRFKKESERKDAVLNLLRAYFIFKDCVDEGERLVEEAGPDPIATVRAMDEWTAAATLERWDAVLMRQNARLRALSGFISGQHHLTVINPELQEKIGKVIGNKSERANSLHGIGAALFFRFMLPMAKSNEERASYVALMAGSVDDLLDMDAARAEIAALRESLDEYRAIVDRLLSDDEIVRLSRQARNETLTEGTQ